MLIEAIVGQDSQAIEIQIKPLLCGAHDGVERQSNSFKQLERGVCASREDALQIVK
jgi:hypothetical protein